MNKSRITPALIDFARETFSLNWRGIHGAPHWARVRVNGLRLAPLTGANTNVIEYFAFLHDLGRENDNHDPEHGSRGAELAKDLNGTLIDLSQRELGLLMRACKQHSDGLLRAEVTVMTCWDADRLDLARVGIDPDPNKLCTAAAKSETIYRPALLRSIGHAGTQGKLTGN